MVNEMEMFTGQMWTCGLQEMFTGQVWTCGLQEMCTVASEVIWTSGDVYSGK